MIGIRSRVNERFYKEREILKRLRSLKINKAEIILLSSVLKLAKPWLSKTTSVTCAIYYPNPCPNAWKSNVLLMPTLLALKNLIVKPVLVLFVIVK